MTEPDRPHAPGGLPAGRVLVGALLGLFGIGWLLEALDVADVPWDVVLPLGLVLIGGLVVAGARRGRGQGGLIALGVVLTLVLAVGTVADVPLEGGVGDRTFHPMSGTSLRAEYPLGVGQLTLDLRDVPQEAFQTSGVVLVHVGIGHVVVRVLRGTLIAIRAHAEVGQVVVFGRRNSGFDVDGGSDPHVPLGTSLLALDVSVGIGEVEVRYG